MKKISLSEFGCQGDDSIDITSAQGVWKTRTDGDIHFLASEAK